MKIEKEMIAAIKTNWNLIKEELNKELYGEFEKLIIKKTYDTIYMMNFNVRIYSNVTRNNYYNIHYIKNGDFDFDLMIDFKPENIDESLAKMTELLESSDYFKKFLGKVALELFYVILYATDTVLNPVYIYLTDDGDGWEPEWTHYLTGTTHQYLMGDYQNDNRIQGSFKAKTPLQIYKDMITFSEYRKLYRYKNHKGFYVLLEESSESTESEDDFDDYFWSGEIVDIKTELTPAMESLDYKYLSLNDIIKRDCRVDCGYSTWASKYDDPMDI